MLNTEISPSLFKELNEKLSTNTLLHDLVFIGLLESTVGQTVQALRKITADEYHFPEDPTEQAIQQILDQYIKVGIACTQSGLYQLTELGIAYHYAVRQKAEEAIANIRRKRERFYTQQTPQFELVKRALLGKHAETIRYIIDKLVQEYSPLPAKINQLISRDFSEEDLNQAIAILVEAGLMIKDDETKSIGIPLEFEYHPEFRALFG